MRDERESSAGIGVAIAAVAVVLVLLVCGGGALLAAGLLFYRASARPVATPPPVVTAVPAQAPHVDVLAIEADGSLHWNDMPVSSVELRERLEVLKNASGPPRSVIVRSDVAAPTATRDEVVQLLNDRGISYIAEESR